MLFRSAGVAPPWIEADKEVRGLLEQRDAIVARAAAGPERTELDRRRDRAAIGDLVADINAAIARVNAEAPTDRALTRRLP